MMKLLLIASAASAWSLGVPKGLPKLNNRALQSTAAKQQQLVATAPASSTALKATEVTGGAKAEDGLMETLKTGSFFALWYLFNIGYNIYNKKTLNALPIPYTMATLQLFIGIPYVMLLWAANLRKAPELSWGFKLVDKANPASSFTSNNVTMIPPKGSPELEAPVEKVSNAIKNPIQAFNAFSKSDTAKKLSKNVETLFPKE